MRNERVRVEAIKELETVWLCHAIVQANGPMRVDLTIDRRDGTLQKAACTCTSGSHVRCRHVAAVCQALATMNHDTSPVSTTPDAATSVAKPTELPSNASTAISVYCRFIPLYDCVELAFRRRYIDNDGHIFLNDNPLIDRVPAHLYDAISTDDVAWFLANEEHVTRQGDHWYLHGATGRLVLMESLLPSLPKTWKLFVATGLNLTSGSSSPVSFEHEPSGIDFMDFDLDAYMLKQNTTHTALEDSLADMLASGHAEAQFVEVAIAAETTHNLFPSLAGASSADDHEADDHLPEIPSEQTKRYELDAAVRQELLRASGQNQNTQTKPRAATVIDHPPNQEDPPYILKPYQRRGVDWLLTLRKHGLGGILADDMGLGKTLQILASIEERIGTLTTKRPSLIVCPKSLLYNWLRETRRFTPTLRVMLISGDAHERKRQWDDAFLLDVIIVAYPTLLTDISYLEGARFELIALDEAQMVKNPRAKTRRAIKRLEAAQIIAMTGTPLENRALDLWSLTDLVVPDLLGSFADFSKNLKNNDQTLIAADIYARILPIMLRRRKADVLPDLPPRIEESLFVRLSNEQLVLYDQIQSQVKIKIEDDRRSGRLEMQRMQYLAALTKLRQVCNHPGLVLPGAKHSAKLELCMQVVETLRAEGKKVLVFSQFTKMLDILAHALTKNRITWFRLDGKTQNRQQVVDEFNASADPTVFLISLKAGGVGLNLTSAESVILFDPWWNPFAENQAADRAHRIGQENPVTIYRLICEDTIESRVADLQAKKRDLFQALVEGGDHAQLVSTAELIEILE